MTEEILFIRSVEFDDEGDGEIVIKSSGWADTAFNITVRQISCVNGTSGDDGLVGLRAGIESCDNFVR